MPILVKHLLLNNEIISELRKISITLGSTVVQLPQKFFSYYGVTSLKLLCFLIKQKKNKRICIFDFKCKKRRTTIESKVKCCL